MHINKIAVTLIIAGATLGMLSLFTNAKYRTSTDEVVTEQNLVTNIPVESQTQEEGLPIVHSFLTKTFSYQKAENLDGIEDLVSNCKKNKAIAHLPVLRTGVEYKIEHLKLTPKLDLLETNEFCVCTHLVLKESLGVETLRAKWRDYDHASKVTPKQLNFENNEHEKAYFSCFGEQIGEPNLSPPSQAEITHRISEPDPVAEERRRIKLGKDGVKNIKLTIEIFKSDTGKLPETLEKLTDSKTRYLTERDIVDPWGSTYIYRQTSNAFTVTSAGPDKLLQTADDISAK